MALIQTIMTRLTAALLALALVVLGFGHQHAPAPPSDPMLAAYMQIGGTLGDLCIESGDGQGDMAQDCPVCTLAKGMAIAPAIHQAGLALRIARLDVPRAKDVLTTRHTIRAPPARGPPPALV